MASPSPLDLSSTAIGRDDRTIVPISVAGNLLLQVEDAAKQQILYYRVSSNSLRSSSRYFNNLLDPQKFSEGVKFEEDLVELIDQFGGFASVPTTALPVVKIADIGQISKTASNKSVLTQFLSILHENNYSPDTFSSSMNTLAMLAIIGDRFDAIGSIRQVVEANIFNISFKIPKGTEKRSENHRTEIHWRQGILAGALLDNPEWINRYSHKLIDGGSIRWTNDDPFYGKKDLALWWNLPGDLEGMMSFLI